MTRINVENMTLCGFGFSRNFIAMKNEGKTIKNKQQKTTEISHTCVSVSAESGKINHDSL